MREAAKTKQRVVVPRNATKEQIAAFRAGAKAEAQAVEEKGKQAVGERLTPREQVFNDLLWQFWDDATWMFNANGFIGNFPDGRPQREQHPWHRLMWGIMGSALARRANRPAKGVGNDERETN